MQRPTHDKRGSRAAFVHGVLRRAILEQALAPGTKLPEDTIGEQLGVSRTVVRRALEKLVADELVVIEPNRGASVARPSLAEARDLFEVRMDMEDLVVGRVSGKLSDAQARELEAAIAREERAHRAAQADYIRHAAKFHLLLAEITGSPILMRYMRTLVARSALVLGLYGRPHWPDCSVTEHRELLAALVSGQTRLARRLMRAHLDAVLTRAIDSPAEHKEQGIREVLRSYSRDAREAAARRQGLA